MCHTLFPLRSVAGWFLRTLVIGCLLCLPSCAEYHVRLIDSDHVGQYQTKTINAWLWGSQYDPDAVFADCEGQGINDVIIVRNLGHDLASILTLGIWMPIEVRYRCHAGEADVAPREDVLRTQPGDPANDLAVLPPQ